MYFQRICAYYTYYLITRRKLAPLNSHLHCPQQFTSSLPLLSRVAFGNHKLENAITTNKTFCFKILYVQFSWHVSSWIKLAGAFVSNSYLLNTMCVFLSPNTKNIVYSLYSRDVYYHYKENGNDSLKNGTSLVDILKLKFCLP